MARLLGYGDPRKAVWDHCRGVLKRDTLTSSSIQPVSFIPERDIYRLIMHSKLPVVLEFEKWVVGIVLPSICKKDSYIAGQETVEDPSELIAATNRIIAEKQRKIEQQADMIADETTDKILGTAAC